MTTHGLGTDVVNIGTLDFVNSWSNYGGVYAPAAYWKDANNIVHLRGVIAGGNAGTVVFLLPLNLRPHTREIFGVGSNVSLGRVDVDIDGSVYSMSTPGAGGFVSLSGITFLAGV